MTQGLEETNGPCAGKQGCAEAAVYGHVSGKSAQGWGPKDCVVALFLLGDQNLITSRLWLSAPVLPIF